MGPERDRPYVLPTHRCHSERGEEYPHLVNVYKYCDPSLARMKRNRDFFRTFSAFRKSQPPQLPFVTQTLRPVALRRRVGLAALVQYLCQQAELRRTEASRRTPNIAVTHHQPQREARSAKCRNPAPLLAARPIPGRRRPK